MTPLTNVSWRRGDGGAATGGIYSAFRTAVFIGRSDTQTEGWREERDEEWLHPVTDKGMLIEQRAMDGGVGVSVKNHRGAPTVAEPKRMSWRVVLNNAPRSSGNYLALLIG